MVGSDGWVRVGLTALDFVRRRVTLHPLGAAPLRLAGLCAVVAFAARARAAAPAGQTPPATAAANIARPARMTASAHGRRLDMGEYPPMGEHQPLRKRS